MLEEIQDTLSKWRGTSVDRAVHGVHSRESAQAVILGSNLEVHMELQGTWQSHVVVQNKNTDSGTLVSWF